MSNNQNNVNFTKNSNNNEKKNNTASKANTAQNTTKKKRSAAAQAKRAARWAAQKATKKAASIAKQETKKAERKAEEERKTKSVLEMFPDVLGVVAASGYMPNIRTQSQLISKGITGELKKVSLFQNVNAATVYPNGMTLLGHYLQSRQIAKAKDLLRKGVSKAVLQQPLPNSYTPFVYAFENFNDMELFNLFLQARDDPNQKIYLGQKQYVPFISWIVGANRMPQSHKIECIEALLNDGGKINAPNWMGETPLEIALKMKENETAKYLVEKGADFTTERKGGFYGLLTAIATNNIPMIELMLSKKQVDLNRITGANGLFPLKIAVLNGGKEVLEYLINKGVDINKQDNLGNTALHYAVFTYNYQKIRMLLSAGANPNIKNKQGDSVINVAAKYENHHNPEARQIYQLLKARQV